MQLDSTMRLQPTFDNREAVISADRLEVGSTVFAGLIYVIDDAKLDRIRLQKIDGILGCDKLLQRLTYLNFAHKELLFYPINADRTTVLKELRFSPKNSRKIVTYGQSSDRIFVETEINDQVTDIAILDIGANSSSIVTPGLIVKKIGKVNHGDIDGISKVDTAQINVGFQGYEVALPEVIFQPEGETNYLLGMDFLRHFELLIDQKEACLYLKPTGKEVVIGPSTSKPLPMPGTLTQPQSKDIPYWKTRLILLYNMYRYEAMIETLARIEKLTTKDGDLCHLQGVALWQTGKKNDAAVVLKRATILLPENKDILLNYAVLSMQLKRYSESAMTLDKLLRKDPTNMKLLIDIGEKLYDMDLDMKARDTFEKATRLSPDSVEAWMGLGKSLMATQESDKALIALNRSMKLDPRNHQGLYYRGHLNYRKSSFKDAFDDFKQASALDPSDHFYWTGYSKSAYRIAKYDEVVAAGEKAVALEPRDSDAWYHIGLGQLRRDKKKEAAAAFKRAVALDPKLMPPKY
jgi:tetratricopeptide (TPR) repeat protein